MPDVTFWTADARFPQETVHILPKAGNQDFHASSGIPDPTAQRMPGGTARDERAEAHSLDNPFHRDKTDDSGFGSSNGFRNPVQILFEMPFRDALSLSAIDSIHAAASPNPSPVRPETLNTGA